MHIPDEIKNSVYVAGAEIKDGVLVNSGGRVLGVTAVAPTLRGAIADAYGKVDMVKFGNSYCRRDIGARALLALED